MEAQAFARVCRIGQEKRTHFVRFPVKATIDQRLYTIQNDKERECGVVMEGDNAAKIRDLSMREVASLFGTVNTTESGTLRVNEDYEVLESENVENDIHADIKNYLWRMGALGEDDVSIDAGLDGMNNNSINEEMISDADADEKMNGNGENLDDYLR